MVGRDGSVTSSVGSRVPRDRNGSMLGVLRSKFLSLGRDEDGAALVITLAIFFLMYLGCMGVYAVSMAVKERIQLQNAADAAAYSAAVVQADTLSRIATINRAMSWTYVDMTRHQMDYIVRRWLGHTCDHYNEDWNGGTDEKKNKHDSLQEYNENSVFKALGIGHVLGPYNGPCPRHRTEGVGWYIGADSGTFRRCVQLNGRSAFKYQLPRGVSSRSLPKVGKGSIPSIRSEDIFYSPDLKSISLEILRMDAKTSVGLVKNDLMRQIAELPSDVVEINAMTMEILVAAPNLVSEQTRMVVLDNLKMANAAVASVKEEATGERRFLDSDPNNIVALLMKMRIVVDKIAIAKMNACERHLAVMIHRRIDNCVRDILSANLALEFNSTAVDVQYLLDQHRALGNEISGSLLQGADAGYLRIMRNTQKDENAFLSFANRSTFDNEFETGINQWFVRGNGKERTDNAYGIQRSYKHWPEGPLAKYHAMHSPLMPSCWNTEKLEVDKIDRSVALFSEWQWWSDTWFCFKVPVPLPPFYVTVHVNAPHMGEDFWPSKAYCSHKSKPGLLGLKTGKLTTANWSSIINGVASSVRNDCIGYKRRLGVKIPYLKYKECTRFVGNGLNFVTSIDNLLGNYESISSYHDGCAVYPDIITHRESLLRFTGYSRLYADDPDLYTSTYVGIKAMPLIVEQTYFGKAGTITVGLRRKNENVFLRVLKKIEGIFTAFDPDWNDGDDTHTYVFASAKAGYKDKGEDADSRQYKIDWQQSNQAWNLCQSDWDAVFVPVRKAYSYAIGGIWIGDDDEVLDDLVVNKASEWKPVAANGDGGYTYQDIYAPRGVLRGNGHNGTLKWRELSHVMYH